MLRLHSVAVRGFRGIREGKLSGFADVNLLVGRNNAGKSTMLEAIARGAEELRPSPLTHTGELSFGRSAVDAFREARGELGQDAGGGGRERPPPPEKWPPDVYFRRDGETGATIVLVPERDPQESAPETGYRRSNQGGAYIGSIGLDLRDFLARVQSFTRADLGNARIENAHWDAFKASRRDKELTKALEEIYGGTIDHVELLPDKRVFVLFPDYGVPLDVNGDGFRNAFRSLFILSQLSKTAFLIEEPESHQHPASLELYAKALCATAKRREVQLFASTHSAECIDAFLEAAKAAGSEAKAAGSEAAVFNLRLEDGVLEARRMGAKTAETIEESGIDLRELDAYG